MRYLVFIFSSLNTHTKILSTYYLLIYNITKKKFENYITPILYILLILIVINNIRVRYKFKSTIFLF